MKRQLTECRMWWHNNFGFGTIFCAFFFKRVSSLSLRETVWGNIASSLVVNRWVVLSQKGGERTIEAFDDKFFDWWSRHIPVIEDYPYARIDFSRDRDMGVPPRVVQGELGMLFFFLFFSSLFNFYVYIYIIFCIYQSIWQLCVCYVQMWGQCI